MCSKGYKILNKTITEFLFLFGDNLESAELTLEELFDTIKSSDKLNDENKEIIKKFLEESYKDLIDASEKESDINMIIIRRMIGLDGVRYQLYDYNNDKDLTEIVPLIYPILFDYFDIDVIMYNEEVIALDTIDFNIIADYFKDIYQDMGILGYDTDEEELNDINPHKSDNVEDELELLRRLGVI